MFFSPSTDRSQELKLMQLYTAALFHPVISSFLEGIWSKAQLSLTSKRETQTFVRLHTKEVAPLVPYDTGLSHCLSAFLTGRQPLHRGEGMWVGSNSCCCFFLLSSASSSLISSRPAIDWQSCPSDPALSLPPLPCQEAEQMPPLLYLWKKTPSYVILSHRAAFLEFATSHYLFNGWWFANLCCRFMINRCYSRTRDTWPQSHFPESF